MMSCFEAFFDESSIQNSSRLFRLFFLGPLIFLFTILKKEGIIKKKGFGFLKAKARRLVLLMYNYFYRINFCVFKTLWMSRVEDFKNKIKYFFKIVVNFKNVCVIALKMQILFQ